MLSTKGALKNEKQSSENDVLGKNQLNPLSGWGLIRGT